jgi:Na+/proline symporter
LARLVLWSDHDDRVIMMIVFIAVAVVVVVLLVRWLGGPSHINNPHHQSPTKTALLIGLRWYLAIQIPYGVSEASGNVGRYPFETSVTPQ